jgi:putative Mg2+ transporter-C (MgtC) family protein
MEQFAPPASRAVNLEIQEKFMVENLYQFFGHGQELEYFLRLLLAVAAGAMVGVEREFRGRPAGLRTHILVTLGAAILSIASIELAAMVNARTADFGARVDVSRIAAGMITGLGFLGAGTIIKMGKTVRGLTTAASLWCAASIGMGFGFGFYRLSLLGSVLMLVTLVVVPRLERGMTRDWYTDVVARIKGPSVRVKELSLVFQQHGWRIADVEMKKDKSRDTYEVKYEMRLRDKHEIEDLAKILEEVDYVCSYRIG